MLSRRTIVTTENRIRAGADAAMGYPHFGMIDLLKLLGGLLVGLFRSRAAREAEMAFLRQQLVVVQRSAPARLRLRTRLSCAITPPYKCDSKSNCRVDRPADHRSIPMG